MFSQVSVCPQAGRCAWQRGACVVKGVHAWQKGTCVAKGEGGMGACVAGETATAVHGTHPIGMHSY